MAWEYRPVRMLARLGEQSALVTKASVKRTPSSATRSMLRVRRMRFAAEMPDTVTAGVPVPITVASPAKYRPGTGPREPWRLSRCCPIFCFGPATEPRGLPR